MTKRPLAKRTIDPAEVWAMATNEKAARAMAQWLKASVFLSRTIASLKLSEMQAMAATANHVWIVEASRRVKHEPDPVQKTKLQTLLS